MNRKQLSNNERQPNCFNNQQIEGKRRSKKEFKENIKSVGTIISKESTEAFKENKMPRK